VRNPGSVTTSLGLIFGPWDPFVTVPRVAISVGNEFPILVTDADTHWVFWSDLVGTRDELSHTPARLEEVAHTSCAVDIEGQAIHFDALHRGDRWIAQGRWDAHVVQIHAVAIEAPNVRSRLTTQVPPHYPSVDPRRSVRFA
jgi:hypothetical protein